MGTSHGAEFNWQAVLRELESSEWEEDIENPGTEVRRVWLGTIYALTPSGKFYAPFACSNVAGDCPVCAREVPSKIDAYVDWQCDDIFIAQSRDVEEADSAELDAHENA